MEQNDYSTRIAALTRQVRGARRKIGEYTKNDVKLIDRDTFNGKLSDIRKCVTEVIDEVDALLEELEDPVDVDKKNLWDDTLRSLIYELKSNEKEVKQAMTRLLIDDANNAAAVRHHERPVPYRDFNRGGPGGAAAVARHEAGINLLLYSEHQRQEMETQKQLAKVEQKRKIINYKAEKLSRTIDDITEVDEDNDDQKTFAELMSNDQIRENLEEGSIWRKISDAIDNEMNDLLIEAAGLPIQVHEFEEMEIKVKIVETKVEKDRKSEVFKTMWQEYSDALDKHMDKHTAGIDSLCEKVSAWSEKL